MVRLQRLVCHFLERKDMTWMLFRIAGVYTFGQPKVGNEEFAYQLRAHAAGTAFYRVTHGNDIVPLVPRRLYTHCGTRIFLSSAADGHIVQGDEAARPAREFWRENESSGRVFTRRSKGFKDHFIKAYVAALRKHYRFNEAILMSPLRKNMPLLRFHDVEKTRLSCDEMRKLLTFDSVINGLKNMTIADVIDTKALTMTAKQRKKAAKTVGRRWLRGEVHEKLRENEVKQIETVYKTLKGDLEQVTGGSS